MSRSRSEKTVVQVLIDQGRERPDQLAYTAVLDGETEAERLTYGELEARARAIGAWLQSHGASGERLLLLFPPGLELLEAFFGALYAGAVCVPAPPPETMRAKRTLPRLRAIVEDARPAMVLTSASLLPAVAALEEREIAGLPAVVPRDIPDELAAEWLPWAPTGDDLAYLQYTSGSTSSPKGVVVRHGNLIHNLRGMAQIGDWSRSTRAASWMPYFHDFGLVEGYLLPLYSGAPSWLMSPLTLLKRPLRWLELVSRRRITHSSGASFALEHCVARIGEEQRRHLDLSSWRTFMIGAEPIRPRAIEDFVAAFGPCGFSPEAMRPGFGMAEATLAVTIRPRTRPMAVVAAEAAALEQRGEVVEAAAGAAARRLVGCGVPISGMRVEIVDPAAGLALPENRVGEVWLAGPSIGGGYWQREVESQATFGARLAGGEGPFLRTGDLGFLRDGELYITGRIKDLIIVRGQNHYPQDIEWTVRQCHPSLGASGAAFPVDAGGEERLVIVHEAAPEVRRQGADEVFAAIRQAVLEHHDLAPWAIALVRRVLKTSSGKIQRSACRQAFLAGELEEVAAWREASPAHPEPAAGEAPAESAAAAERPAAAAVRAWLAERIGSRVGVAASEVDVNRPFAQYGLDSMRAVQLAGELEEWLGRTLSPTLLYEHSTIAALARFLAREEGGSASAPIPAPAPAAHPREPIAVLGMACRLPGAETPEAFWRLLREGRDAVREVPADRWDVDAFYDPDPDRPGTMCTRRGGFIDGADRFDAAFFNIAPREAMAADPQQRLALEVSWEALERAGIAPGSLMGSATGVFLGIASTDYAQLQARQLGIDALDGHRGTGTALCIAANRVSYCLGLEGPSMAVDTACSSSLAAVHLACQSLRAGECELALAGGVNLMLSPDLTIVFTKARMLAPDGRCKTFDAAADGYVRGEGCGMVVLKRLSAARADGDPVLAVIRGSAVNQDGLSNGLTAPNGQAQQAVIASAVAAAGIDPLAVGYVEAHGTGTALGDPIEMQALAAVLCAGRPAERPLVVGSVKTNVGHLEAAAGIAGLLKVVLSLQHREIPPHLHFRQPSPYIPWERLPVAVPTAARPWEPAQVRRVAGISSFGFGGTNVHLIVEEAPPAPAAEPAELRRPRHLLALSAKSGEALRDLAGRWLDHLSGEVDLADACWSAALGRSPFAHRLALPAASAAEARERLAAFLAGEEDATPAGRAASGGVRPVFLFTGQGAQRPGMARQLFATQPVFRRALLECEELLRPHLPRPLTEVLYGGGDEVMQTDYAQPALFAVEYALARIWESWGILPAAVLGHSVGEYVAACVAGVLEPAEALRLIAVRGRLMQATEPGAMAAVEAAEERVAAVLEKHGGAVAIAAINGPGRVVVSGAGSAVAAALAELAAEGVRTRLLEVSRAFHSPLIEPVLDAFAEAAAAAIPARAPRLDLVSNLTGEVWPEGQAIDASYWRRHARQPVRFAAGVEALARRGHKTFLELGPAPTLLGLAGRIVPEALLLPSLRPGREDWEPLLDSLARLWVAGAEVDWAGFDRGHGRRRVAVPTSPFQRQRYWFEAPADRPAAAPARPARSFLGRRLRSPRLGGEVLFEADFAVSALPFLADHRVYDRVVVSGASHIARVLAGAVAAFGPGPHALEEVELPQALVLAEDETVPVQLSIRSEEGGRAVFEVWSPEPGREESWLRHAAGRLRSGGEPPASWLGAPDLAALRERCREEIAGEVLNAAIRDERKIALGPTFTWIEHVWRRDGEALGRLRPPRPEERPEAAPLHPGLADGFFQIFEAAVLREALTEGFAYVPAGVDRYYFDPRGGTPAWCHASGRTGDSGDAGTITGEVRVWDERGSLVLAAEGIYLRRARAATLLGARRERPEGWLVEPRWEAAAPASRPASAPGRRTWLLFADRMGVAEALAERLRAQGDRCRLAFAGPDFGELPGGDLRLDPEAADDFGRCLDAVRAEEAPAEVVYLWSLDLAAGDPDPGGSEAAGALHLVRALGAAAPAGAAIPPRLTFVTRGAQPAGEKGSGALAQSLLWGLVRTLGHEHPELRSRAIDLDPAAWEGEIETLAAELEAGGDERQIAFRAGVRETLRLFPWKGSASAGPALRADRTYLITGGLGALGLALAGWLVERGARHLLLLGRRPPGKAASARLATLTAAGARVLSLPADVADRPALAAALEQAQAAGMPPLCGVIHAAGVLDDGLLQDQDRQRFARVLAPKVAGAWNLHLLTRDVPLDFLVLFSSVAALLGSAGQGSYAAANAFLDALAWHRRALGLPALALDWGPWAEAGMAAGAAAADRERWRRMGIELLPTEQGLLLLGEALSEGAPPQLGAAACDWARLAAALPGARALVAGWALAPRGTEAPAQPAAELLREQLAELPPRERRDLLVGQVRARVARILRLERAESLERQQPLMDLGLDSLMTIELRNALGSLVGRALPATLIFKYPTIEALAGFLEGELAGAEPAAAEPAAAAPAGSGPDEAESAEHEAIAALTQDQTLALLAEELEELELLAADLEE